MMDIRIANNNVTRDTFNALRESPFFTDLNDNPILKPVTSEDMDAYGILNIPVMDGNAISISVFYSLED
jgi:hypothetical protein